MFLFNFFRAFSSKVWVSLQLFSVFETILLVLLPFPMTFFVLFLACPSRCEEIRNADGVKK